MEPRLTVTGADDLAQLAVLDPARDRVPDAGELARAEAQIERIMIGGRGGTVVPRHRRPAVRRLAVGLAAATAAAAAVVVAWPAVLPGGAGTAYASWTPVPEHLSGEQALPLARKCAKNWSAESKAEPIVASDVVLAERRGDATLLVAKRRTATAVTLMECLSLHPEQAGAWMSLADEGSPLKLNPGTHALIETQSSHGSDDTEYSNVVGRIDPSVTGIEVLIPGRKLTIETTIGSGWWAAWWPGPEGGEVDSIRIVVHTASEVRTYRQDEL